MFKNQVCCCTITWSFRPRNPLGPDAWDKMIPDVLRQIQQAGYAGVELGAHLEALGGVEATRDLLAETGLELARVGSTAPLREALPKFQALGVQIFMVGTPHRKQFPGGVPPAEEYSKVAAELEETAKISLEEFGIATTLHNHLWTMAESRAEVDRLFERAPHLRLMLDVAHLQAAGADPVQMIRDYGPLIAHVHVKDRDDRLYVEEPLEPGFVSLGRGNIGLDVPACLEALQEIGYRGWLSVELDTSDTPFEDNLYNREYLAKLGY